MTEPDPNIPPPPPKSGWKSSEFWGSQVSTVIGAWLIYKGASMVPVSEILVFAGCGLSGLPNIVYGLQRTIIKGGT